MSDNPGVGNFEKRKIALQEVQSDMIVKLHINIKTHKTHIFNQAETLHLCFYIIVIALNNDSKTT